MKKILSFVLALIVLIISVSTGVFTVSAASNSGNCGSNAIWTYDPNSKTLLISGSGAIDNYTRNYNTSMENSDGGYYTTAPWWNYYSETEHLVIEEGITSIGKWCFYDFKNVKSVSLPTTLKTIESRAFHCFAGDFGEIVFPDSLQEIGEYAFDGSHIKRLVIPGSIKTIHLATFHYCEYLKEVVIKEGCTKIDSYAFNNCFVLSDITIPATVKTIGAYSLCRQNPPDGWYAYSGYKGLCIYGEKDSYARQYASSNDIAFMSLSNTNNALEYPIYYSNEYTKLIKNWIENSQYATSFSGWIAQGHTYAELLDMTVDIPLVGNDGKVYSVIGSTTVKDLMAYIIFADVAQDYLLEALDSVRNSIQNNNVTDAYQNFFKVIKNFQSQYYYFQDNLNGGNDFQQTLYSLLLAKTILTVVDNSGIKDVKYAFDIYKGSVSESPQYYDDLYYYVMSGGDTSYLNSSYASTMKGLGLVVKDSKQSIKIIKSGISSEDAVSYITLGLDNLSYFADTYEWDYKDKIKTAKEAWGWADTTIGYAKAITTYSLVGTLSSSWKLSNAYIDEVKKIYTNAESTDAGWYALTYFYLMDNNKNLLNALIDQDTGAAEFGIDRIAQYGIPYNGKDVIEKSIVSYWNKKAYLTYTYTPNEKMRLYLWNASNIANTIMEIDVEDYCDMVLQYVLAEINYQNGIAGIKRTIIATANDGSLGTVSGSGQYAIGSEVTLVATPDNNVTFSGWKDITNNKIVSTNNSYTFALNNDTNIQAIFTAGNARSAQSPIITSQPVNIIVEKGQNAELLNVDVESPDGGTIRVAWYRNVINRTSGGVLVANGATLQPDSSEVGTYYYYAVITNELTDYIGSNEVITTASTYSNIVKVTVNEPIVVGLSVETLPSKQSYITGETLDTSDMVVLLHYSNGISLPIDDYFLEYDFSEIGRQKVVVLMLNYQDCFCVDVSCGHEFDDWIIDTPSTPNSVGYRHHICTVCGNVETEEIPMINKLSFKGASLTLQNDLSVNYIVDESLFGEDLYTNPYVVFEINGVKTTVKNYSKSDNGYKFSFNNISPDKMNDNIYATLYAQYNGTEYASVTREYSIAEYCYSMLDYYSTDAYANLRTLLVDLLNYGAYTQNYTGHNTENLVNANLTDEQKAWASGDIETFTDALNTKYATVDNPTVKWRGAELELNSAITMKFVIQTDSVEGLTVKITDDNGHSWTVKSSTFKKYADGYYYVYFNGLDASQMSENIYLTVYSGDTIVSNTVRYSIESYASAMKDSTNDQLSTLVHSMMKYGNSAKQYKNKGVN